MPALEPAALEWDGDGQPRSAAFGDVYFSRHNGLEETRYVFLTHNHLAERWAALQPGTTFTVAETGFGTGLNFLAAWQLWERTAPEGTRLQMISVEKYPLSPADLDQSLALWPELAGYAEALRQAYPLPTAGFHRLTFAAGRVSLTLLLGDAAERFSQLHARVDAWFLDGFAPARNPQMWSDALFAQIARLSRAGTTFATFTAAGLVRRGLQAQGFDVEKVPGFGRKREMLRGQCQAPVTDPEPRPWFRTPPAPRGRRAAVIGGGLAGCSTAFALARRGWQVTLLERGDRLAAEASGNPQGALYLKLPPQPTTASRIQLAGYQFTQHLLTDLLEAQRGQAWDRCGLLQLAYDAAEQRRQQKLIDRAHYPPALVQAVDAATASQLAGQAGLPGGLLFPDGAWVSPGSLCQALADHPAIQLQTGSDVQRLAQRDGSWTLLDGADTPLLQADCVVLANAAAAQRFSQCDHLPLKPIRGQVSYRTAPAHLPPLPLVLCAHGYIAPPRAGRYCFGASFNLHETTSALREEDHRHNLGLLEELFPALLEEGHEGPAPSGRVGFRCATPDYLPLVGPLPDYAAYLEQYAALRHNARAPLSAPAQAWPGLYINAGHGSKGLTTAPLCGELLAAQISEEPWPLEIALAEALHPARFIIKNLSRRTI